MSEPAPKVTVLIATRDRPDQLRITLGQLKLQDYRPIELIVIDDCSERELESMVKEEWPDSMVIRNRKNLGYIASRSLGMRIASGEYVVTIDDDSCFTDCKDISRAVSKMDSAPKIGVLTFLIHNGLDFQRSSEVRETERYIQTFIGCGAMIRKAVIRQIGGYCDFYHYYAEENEYSLRVLDAGWRILFFPTVAIHHRVSILNRRPGKIWAYGVRNSLWTAILRIPVQKLPVELFWKWSVMTLDAARLLRVKWYFWAVWSTLRNLPQLVRLRKPISPDTLLFYDNMRFGSRIGPNDPTELPPVTWRQRMQWLSKDWRSRRRSRPFWDRRSGGIGRSAIAKFPSDTLETSLEAEGRSTL